MKRVPVFVWVAVVILCLGAAIVVQGNWAVWTHEFTPLDLPLPHTPAKITQEFVVDSDYPHAIQVVVQRKLPFEQLTCSVGIPPLPHREVCEKYPNVLEATWTVSTDGQVVASGSSAQAGGAWYSSDIGREIGNFEGKSGQRYRLDVEFRTDNAVLAPTNPRLQVQVPSLYLKDVYVGLGLSWLLGEICAAVAVLILVIGFVAGRIRRSREAAVQAR
jgi:hypothetical protein